MNHYVGLTKWRSAFLIWLLSLLLSKHKWRNSIKNQSIVFKSRRLAKVYYPFFKGLFLTPWVLLKMCPTQVVYNRKIVRQMTFNSCGKAATRLIWRGKEAKSFNFFTLKLSNDVKNTLHERRSIKYENGRQEKDRGKNLFREFPKGFQPPFFSPISCSIHYVFGFLLCKSEFDFATTLLYAAWANFLFVKTNLPLGYTVWPLCCTTNLGGSDEMSKKSLRKTLSLRSTSPFCQMTFFGNEGWIEIVFFPFNLLMLFLLTKTSKQNV